MRRRRLLSSETDRNTASPTDSAVWRRRGREHSGADRLNAKIIDQWISVGLYGLHTLRAWVGKDTDHECFVVLFFSMRVVPRNNKRTLFRPGIQRSILRAFFCLFRAKEIRKNMRIMLAWMNIFLRISLARSHIEMECSVIEMVLKKTKITKIRIIPSRTLQHFMQKECTKQWKWWPV